MCAAEQSRIRLSFELMLVESATSRGLVIDHLLFILLLQQVSFSDYVSIKNQSITTAERAKAGGERRR